jgi:Trypsin-like peptidase domain
LLGGRPRHEFPPEVGGDAAPAQELCHAAVDGCRVMETFLYISCPRQTMRTRLPTAVVCTSLLLAAPLSAKADDLNTDLMKATFKLANDKSTATAFLLSRPVPGNSEKPQFILVTAAHVFEQMAGNEATLILRRQESEGVYKKVPVNVTVRRGGKPLWTKHPSADVAVLVIVPPSGTEIPSLPVDLLATDDTLKKYALHPGDMLRCLGYPHRVEANGAGFPILRSGPVATFPLTPTEVNKTFLLSVNTFEGDSGGPVYLAEASRAVEGRRQPEEVRLIVGLVTGMQFLDEEAKMIYGTMRVRHRLGLAIVVHATFIRETIKRMPRNS